MIIKSFFLFCGLLSPILFLSAQLSTVPFNANWQFHKPGDTKWYNAEVPGTVHTDLFNNKLIPDPFYRDNEPKLQWIEKEDWEYRTIFSVGDSLLKSQNLRLVFDGLDTYADVFLNGKLLLKANNMFRQWKLSVKNELIRGANELRIIFSSAARHDDSMAALSPLRLAGENNRMYSRKAQYQYGWDWGPRFVTAGIWKPVHWELSDDSVVEWKPSAGWNVKLEQKDDAEGRSFYFSRNGEPVYIKGANWIPCESFIPRAEKLQLYEKLVKEAKEANINMLRVWGGGIYEEDIFYDLCDQYGIMVWQDFMFAGAMYPVDKDFYDNVEAEVRYQVSRLRHHPCIVLWCGNNEIDEAWHNWGWQKQYGYSSDDSTRLWKGYKRIFEDLIPRIIQELDPGIPYWPSSPSIGWGRDSAYKQGDVHYWGVWWGKEPVEKYKEKVGRFNSEYGMQAFPVMETIKQFALPADMDTSSAVMKVHQKHPFGYQNIREYINNKFRSPKNFKDLVYVSQLMQADAIKTAIDAHRSAMPYNMGTLFWQWNDCWPVVSWSAVDYYGRKKALYYQVKRSFADDYISLERADKKLIVKFQSVQAGKQMLMVRFYDRSGKLISTSGESVMKDERIYKTEFSFDPRRTAFAWVSVNIAGVETSNTIYFEPPKNIYLPKPKISFKVTEDGIELETDHFAYGVELSLPEGIEPADNFFELLPGIKKTVRLNGKYSPAQLQQQVSVRSLADLD